MTAPSLSVALTVSDCRPGLAKRQSTSYGTSLRLAKVSSPDKNSTSVTSPSLSDTVTLTFNVDPTLTPLPAMGEVMTTSGSTFGGSTVTLTASEVDCPSRSSVATAVNTTSVAVEGVQSNSNGASLSSPSRVSAAKNCTLVMAPSLSAAVASRRRTAPALKKVPSAGCVSATVGNWFAITGRSNLLAIIFRTFATSSADKVRLYTNTSATAPP